MRRSQSRRRSTSRSSGHTCAMSWCASSTGWACCMWVRPGITVRPALRDWSMSAMHRSSSWLAMTRDWRRSHMRISAAIWSLRERPARSLPPSSSPAISSRPRSSAVASSSSSSTGANAPVSTRYCSSLSATSMRCSSSEVSSPARARARACAREPAMSSSASRQSNCVDLLSAASSGDGPDENRPPHNARCSPSCVVPSVMVSSLSRCLAGRKRAAARGSCRGRAARLFAQRMQPPGDVPYSTSLSGTSMPLPNFTSRAAATLVGRP